MLILTPDGAKRITVTIAGKTFDAGQRTVAHLLWTIEQLAKQHPGVRLTVVQGAYNTGVTASAGTHDKDGVLDVEIDGLSGWQSQRFLREHGWAAWFRFPPTFPFHIHMVSIGCPGPVGIFVPGQLDDYFRHALGLAGQHESGDDTSWFPADISKTIFNYPAYLRAQEDSMPYTDWPAADRQALITDLVDALAASDKVAKKNADVLLAQQVDDDPKTNVKTALRQGAQNRSTP